MADTESEAKSVSDEELEFHDAEAGATPPSSHTPSPTLQSGEVDIASGIIAIETAMDMMNKNMFNEAIQMLKPRADTCMYHSMAFSSVMFLKAGFSMDAETIESATGELNKTIALCSAQRRNVGIVSSLSNWMFGNSRMDNFSALELHAEIYYAEANLLLSFLTFVQDESLMSFVKGGFRIRSCYSLYKHLYEWLKTCETEKISLEANFTSGVRMGMGSFNLFLSLVPGRILKVLEFVGFSGNRELGMTELERGATSGTFRAPICTAFLLFYHTMLTVTLGVGEVDPDYAEGLLNPHLEKYPKSVQFLYFKGRISLLHGDIDKAIVCFNEAINVQAQWKQVHHLCWWELMWCYCAKMDWETAATYADMLYKQSKWSKATFLYITACCQIMPGEGGQAPVDRDEVKTIMGDIPAHKQTIAGKNLPIEKFAILKSERFIKGSRLPLAIPFEIMMSKETWSHRNRINVDALLTKGTLLQYLVITHLKAFMTV
ncbi:tetratricopeptide repeat protein 39A-like isoform X2 [Halichondria panicea]|uniref:tetratricopeptide repeat protein 39A-like isoform X2 n=1 Tax=Halichondria panicea TaxID=6063 RepID=UPI00312B5770